MNRRMPNGTYGGVRGWGREAPAYSINQSRQIYALAFTSAQKPATGRSSFIKPPKVSQSCRSEITLQITVFSILGPLNKGLFPSRP